MENTSIIDVTPNSVGEFVRVNSYERRKRIKFAGREEVKDDLTTFYKDKSNWPLVGVVLGAFFVIGMIIALGPLALVIGFGALLIWANNKKKEGN